MLSGMYRVEFLSNKNTAGGGLLTIKDGIVNGGDISYLYQGRFEYYEDNIKATIEVKHYYGKMDSVFGPLRSFTLSLSGIKVGDAFDLSGGIVGMQGLSIRIRGEKVADLFE